MKKKSTLPPGFEPGTHGYHELLDRTFLLAQTFGDFIAEHPSAKHPKLAKQVQKAEDALCDLYQKIGSLVIHLAKAVPAAPATTPAAASTGDPNAEWRKANPKLAADCRKAADTLNKIFNEQMQTVADRILGNDMDGYSEDTRDDFLDACGPRVQHLTLLLGVLNQLGGIPVTGKAKGG